MRFNALLFYKKKTPKNFEPSVEPQKYKTYFLSSWKIIIFFLYGYLAMTHSGVD